MIKSKKKIILLTTGLILTICLMAFFGVYALTILKNSTFNVEIKYEPEYLVKVEMGIDGANGGTVNQNIEDNEEDNEYVEIFNSLNPVSNGMYIQSMSNDTIHINSQTLTPIGANGDVYFKITSLENETSGKDLKCVIDCGSSTVDSGKLVIDTPKILTIATGINATNGTVTSSSLGMIKINLQFSEFLLDLKYLTGHDANVLYFGEADTIETSPISGTTFYVSDINGLLKLSALVGKVNTKTEDGSNYGSKYGYNNSAGPAITFKDATIQMLNSIDCGNTSDFTNAKTFIPIGNATNSFQGTFDGNNNTITGLYIKQTTDYAGLFGYVSNAEDVSNAEIKNLKMQNCKVVGASYVGNFVGYANNSSISNCSADCSAEDTGVSGSSDVGGIVGSVGGAPTITNCYNTGSVSGNHSVGGIVGGVYIPATLTITNCYNTGSVGGDGSSQVGGIVGYASVAITNCYNTGSVGGDGSSQVGGIVGSTSRTTTITNCYNTESVSGAENVGGIAGGVNGATTITNCYNTGSVSGGRVGGIVGDVSFYTTLTIKNCYNAGSVSGSDYVGGIVGRVDSDAVETITNCYYLESSSSEAIGGSGRVTGSYYGTFNDKNIVELPSGTTWPSDWGELKDYKLATVLNAYIEANPTYNGINLKSWVSVSGGYPIFE